MMNHSKTIVSLALVGLMVFATSANAATERSASTSVEQSGVAHEVNSCVAAVREHLDYTDAASVKHDVLAIERRTVGYTLKIRTMLYDAAGDREIRAYKATCVVNGNNAPLNFAIEEDLDYWRKYGSSINPSIVINNATYRG